jgi:GAF domain-containing protein/HAMP domain-containing protein
MNLRIRTKIVLITVVILFLSIGINILISSYMFAREYSDALQSEMYVIGQGLALQLDRLLRLGIPVQELLGFEEQCQEVVSKYEEISYAMVVDTEGRILFHNDPSQHGRILTDSATLKAVSSKEDVIQIYSQQEENYYDITIPVFDTHGQHVAAVRIGFPAKLIARKTGGLVAYSGVAALVSLGLATTALVLTLSVWVTNPLARLLAVVQEVREKGAHLARRVEIDSKDEIGEIVSAFNSMTEQLRDLISGLEQRVADRTRGLQAAAEVARATTSVLAPDQLLRQVVDLARERFDLYYVGLFLLDEEGRFAVLRAGTGKAGQEMLVRGHRLEVGGDSMVGQCVARAEVRIALDVGEEAVRFDNPFLPKTRSEMALPLRSRGRVIGAMTVQSEEEAAFDEADIAVMQTMADQAAVAIDNAQLFAETQTALQEMEAIHHRYLAQAWAEYRRDRTTSGYEYSKKQGQTEAGMTPLGDELLPEVQQAIRERRQGVGSGNGDTGQASASGSAEEIRPSSVEAPTAEASVESVQEPSSSALVVPLMLRGQPIGALGFKEKEDGEQWSAEEIALAEAISEQFALASENLRLFEETQRRAARERLIGEVTARMRETLDVDTVLQAAVREIGEALGLHDVTIQLEMDGDRTD